jgi:hypothetical protein
MKFIAGLHLVSEAPNAPDCAHSARLEAVNARFYDGLTTVG